MRRDSRSAARSVNPGFEKIVFRPTLPTRVLTQRRKAAKLRILKNVPPSQLLSTKH